MKAAVIFCLLACLAFFGFAAEEAAEKEFPTLYVCEAADESFLGVYTAGRERTDDAPIYSNDKDMSFFRNKGFWYLGDLAPWPPATHYRCVEADGCNFSLDFPPTNEEGAWKGSKKFNDGSAPKISRDPCNTNSFDEL